MPRHYCPDCDIRTFTDTTVRTGYNGLTYEYISCLLCRGITDRKHFPPFNDNNNREDSAIAVRPPTKPPSRLMILQTWTALVIRIGRLVGELPLSTHLRMAKVRPLTWSLVKMNKLLQPREHAVKSKLSKDITMVRWVSQGQTGRHFQEI